ncbi:hypothetical protein [Flavobacterium cerinum]|uniref:Uncharacterized protein n=1 Tax=Flavobacterium cerinum TaxID=2502784 RepID=A0ABY5IP21_9FLAO|nr:hypothetical protein [Flavobacterium cerinum]UUC44384.1 hypothetical protein NOX80_12145 [Flavobacterium cerinum]
MIQDHKKIYDLFKSSTFNMMSNKIVFEYSENIEAQLTALDIDYEKIRTESIEVNNDNFPLKIFENYKSYLKLNEVKHSNVLILNINERPYSFINGETYIDFILDSGNFFFTNSRSFDHFLTFLKEQDKDTDEAFHFVDYYNSTNRKIVFTSLTDKGRLIIKFFNEINHFEEKVDLSKSFSNFKNCFSEENHHLPKFLKNSIIDFASRYDSDTRIYQLYENLNTITNKAKVNFEIYLNNLSIDKIRKDYDEYKSKYFKEVSDILNNLTQKIIGLPLLIATTLFAIEKVKENHGFLYILIVTTLITSVYLFSLLKINYNDLDYVDKLSNEDFKTLKENKFFIKNQNEMEIFLEIKKRVSNKINHLKCICESYFWVSGVSNILTICYILHFLNLNFQVISFLALFFVFLMTIFRNEILNKSKR